jgi:very-short-patch-repair endonuclease
VLYDVDRVVGPDGWTTWEKLTGRISPTTVRSWVASGRLVRLGCGLYVTPAAAGDWRLRVRAAVRQQQAVVSHGTALALWGLVQPPSRMHLSVEPGRSGRGTDGVVLHRTAGLDWHVRRVDGIPVTSVERSLVDAWGSPADIERHVVRAAVIDAVRRRMCRVSALRDELALRPRLPGRRALGELVELLADGCRSELEIWGCLHVLRAPGMPPFVQQREIVVAGRRHFLDAAYDEVLLAVEMDGAAWHGSQEQREADLRRDALVATIGWQTLRFSFRRMTKAREACRREIRATYDARLRLFRTDDVR